MPLAEATLYEAPFLQVERYVKPKRAKVQRERYGEIWWLHARPGHDMRAKIKPLDRFLGTPVLAKHRVFVWLQAPTLPDHQLVVFAFSTDYYLGILHSRLHEVWSLRLGTRQETRPRYTPTTCFETFPFPLPTPEQEAAIAEAAKELDELRSRWLNPPEWTREEILEFPGSADGPWARYVHDPDSRGIGTVRYPRLVPRDEEAEKKLRKRILTNLYNERPTWLDLAHRKLDEAVFAAYGWSPDLSDAQILERLLALNLERAAAEGAEMLPLVALEA